MNPVLQTGITVDFKQKPPRVEAGSLAPVFLVTLVVNAFREVGEAESVLYDSSIRDLNRSKDHRSGEPKMPIGTWQACPYGDHRWFEDRQHTEVRKHLTLIDAKVPSEIVDLLGKFSMHVQCECGRWWLLDGCHVVTYRIRESDFVDTLNVKPTKSQSAQCAACRCEAEFGTPEIPHPVDPRIHTCVLPDGSDFIKSVEQTRALLRWMVSRTSEQEVIDAITSEFGTKLTVAARQ